MDIYHPAKLHPDWIRDFVVSAHARFRASNCLLGYLFVFFLGGGRFFKSSTAKKPAPTLTENTSKDAVPRKDVPFRGRKTQTKALHPFLPPKTAICGTWTYTI